MQNTLRSVTDPRQNHLLAALPASEWERLSRHLQPLEFTVGSVLCESSSPTSFVYFPTTAVISLVCTTQEGGTSEIAVVGKEGVVGICLIMGGATIPSRAVVQSAGQGFRLPSHLLKHEVDQAGPVLQLLLRYTQSVMSQVTQTAACNRYHSIEQQLARRLLLGLDRSFSQVLAMTHEAAANLLGVRREGVTAAALRLQEAGVIRYQRGHIDVLDRDRLEHFSCECYAPARRKHDRRVAISPLPELAVAA